MYILVIMNDNEHTILITFPLRFEYIDHLIFRCREPPTPGVRFVDGISFANLRSSLIWKYTFRRPFQYNCHQVNIYNRCPGFIALPRIYSAKG